MVSNSPSNNNASNASSVALRQRILSLTPAQQAHFREQLEAKGISWEQALGNKSADDQESLTQRQIRRSDAAPRPDKIPLSALQQHLWVVHKLYPKTCAYHIAIALRIQGSLSVSVLEESLKKIIGRHEALRTVFIEADNQPYVKVLPTVDFSLPIIDLVADENQELTLNAWKKQLVNTPFDLSMGPLLRAQLFQLADHTFKLVIVLHHLIADGWSRGILLREIAAYYRGETALPPLTIQYPDYVLEQHQWLESDAFKEQLSYWKQQLAGVPELDLQTASPQDGESGPDYTSQTCIRHFSPAQSDDIKRVAQQSGTTVFVLLIAVFQLLLHRYSRQRDIAVGVPVAGRGTSASEALIGFFVNTLVLRTQIEPEDSFSDWLRQVQATLADALQYQDVPFAKVVDAMEVQRTPGQNPLFRVMFQVQSSGYELQNAEQLDLQLPGLTLTQQWIAPTETKFDMSWHVIERDGQLLVAVEYRQALFERDRVEHMLTHFQTLVNVAIAHPGQPTKSLSLLTPTEKSQIITDWSQGETVRASQICFPRKFEQQVEKTPDATAVVDRAKQTTLTYRQLNQRANKLAYWLRQQSVGTHTEKQLVGLYLPAGIDLLTAIIATLKAGGAYIPLDVALPQSRIQQMLQDAQPSVLITHSSLEDAVSTSAISKYPVVFCIDKEEHRLIAQPGHNLSSSPSPEHLAYLIYTSGSTGKPKGTQLTHAGLTNYLNWCLSAYPITEGCGAPVQSSVGFDATITSLFSPLLAGKQVVFNLADNEIEAIQSALSGGFSFIKLTPAHLSALQPLILSQSLDPDLLPKALIIGGEALHSHHIELWQQKYPQVSLFNEYGPTEATVGCCVHVITAEDRSNIPIGKPIDGARLYVLDAAYQLVPPGIAGELYIGGAGVATGYFNQPSLTADKFVQVSWLEEENSSNKGKLYKTGDLVRYRTDGVLEYLGRIDDQLKLRGFRIEPGEIEALLCQHPSVAEAVVVLTRDKSAPHLAAYIVINSSIPDEAIAKSGSAAHSLTDELRQQLSEALPAYMVPTYITVLESLPLTSNGKIDRSALPTPELAIAPSKPSSPRNEKEHALVDIWQQILGTSSLGIHDNFFELGGDSISAMQIVSKAAEQGFKLTPRQLFEHQTVAEQAMVMQAAIRENYVEAPETGAILLSPSQQDFFNQNRLAPHHYNQALLLMAKETIQTEALKAALEAVAQQHGAFRLRYQQVSSEQGNWRQRYAETTGFAFEEIALEHSGTALSAAIEQSQRSLNLNEGPLFNATLITLPFGQRRLLLVAHHLVVDGVSWRIFLSDLLSAYRQLMKKQAVTLPPRTAAFGTWVQHLNKQTSSAEIQSEKRYWTEICASTARLPIERPDGQNKVSDTAEVLIEISIEQTRTAKSMGHVDALLLTALGQTLRQWSQQDEVIVDIEGHGRKVWNEAIDLTRTTGWFTARYPFSLRQLSIWEGQVGHVVQQLQQVPNQGVGFGMLRTYGSDSGQLAAQLASPAQVSFNYLGQLVIEPNEAISGLAPEPVVALQDPTSDRPYLFDIVALTESDQLRIRWHYSQQQYRRETIEQLAQQFSANIQSLLNRHQPDETSSVSSAQFSSAPVKARQLDQLLGKLKTREGHSS